MDSGAGDVGTGTDANLPCQQVLFSACISVTLQILSSLHCSQSFVGVRSWAHIFLGIEHEISSYFPRDFANCFKIQPNGQGWESRSATGHLLCGFRPHVKYCPCRAALQREQELALAHLYELCREAGLIVCSMHHF